MAEAILSRSTTIPEDVLNPIYPVEGRHVILMTVRSYEGNTVYNAMVNCKDGNTYYNYTTNEQGQVKFSCNSGAANIFVNNIIDGKNYIDINSQWINIAAPVGDTTRLNFNFNKVSEFTRAAGQMGAAFNYEHNYYVLENCTVNKLYIVGGGGGGSRSCGGGSGYMNTYNNYLLIKNNRYEVHIANGGNGGVDYIGNAGGTSYIANTNISAVGGSGGTSTTYKNFGYGGLGNGSNSGPGEDSPVNFAGGGGSIAGNGGKPYGGGYHDDGYAHSASNGGGGGASLLSGSQLFGDRGGGGVLKIIF